jgi:hypothetical protein
MRKRPLKVLYLKNHLWFWNNKVSIACMLNPLELIIRVFDGNLSETKSEALSKYK